MKKEPIKQLVKRFLLSAAPQAAGAWQSARQRRHIQRFEQRLGLPKLTTDFIEEHGSRVLSGPFVGMAYVAQARGSALMPKLLGSYEEELHEVMEKVVATDYMAIIDIGCAEGYYANGLAMRMPSARIYAFDTDLSAQALCAEMARLNAVEARVSVFGECRTDDLNTLLTKRSLIICDCEGFESEILRPDLVPAMARTDILVELHDHVQPGITPLILKRFEDTHRATTITAAERDATYYPQLRFPNLRNRQLAVSEFRQSGQQWVFLASKLFPPGETKR